MSVIMPPPLRLALAILFLLAPAGVRAAEPDLQPLRAALAPLRTTQGVNRQRDAGPELTPVKHALRSWVEAQLPAARTEGPNGAFYNSPSPDDLRRLGYRLSDALVAAGLTCGVGGTPTRRCGGWPDKAHPDEDARGYIGNVRLRMIADRYLAVTTEVGVHCGYDQSLYLYDLTPDHRGWRLVFQSEQDDYRDGHYDPQVLLSVDVSQPRGAWNEPTPPPLVLTLGFSPWCQSNWQMIYTRLWRTSPTALAPKPLLDRKDELYIGDYFIAAGRVANSDALIEFNGRSLDEGTLVGRHVLHYAIGPSDRLTRIAPFAHNPTSFVDEWLQTPGRRPVAGSTPGRLLPRPGRSIVLLAASSLKRTKMARAAVAVATPTSGRSALPTGIFSCAGDRLTGSRSWTCAPSPSPPAIKRST